MRAGAPPRPQGQPQAQPRHGRPHKPETPVRKIFNCIVDDSAFLAGVKKSTRDGIRKWINNGAMRLFVPLYTLEQMDRMRRAGGKTAQDATDALQWLDDVTSINEVQAAGLVQLQGGDEVYKTWAEVEGFLLPETLLSMTESTDEADHTADELHNSIHSQSSTDKASESSVEVESKASESPRSTYSSTSPDLLNATPFKPEKAPVTNGTRATNGNARNRRSKKEQKPKSFVPQHLQPFFNHVIWRIHHEQNPEIGPESFILLTNDPKKQAIAQRFSVRAKRLEQMRDIIGREERDFRNRQAYLKREAKEAKDIQEPETQEEAVPDGENSDDEDEVVFKRELPSRPKSATQPVFDPNEFSRTQHVAAPAGPSPTQQNTHRGRGGRGGNRGGRSGFPNTGGANPRAPRNSVPAPKIADTAGPIDPDSFTRPPPATRSLRGGRRKLWEPA
ncbi:hypothetical protein IWX49DRAFT_112725 [Phyllosticta citricarpa]|uniref:PIN domain-containing protein n=2 Tax=Phyllosticta TaxID=121621 RepID=A0ABR1MDH8_9PEZI